MKVVLSSLTCENGSFTITSLIKTNSGYIHKTRIIKDSLALNWIKSNKYSEVLAVRKK